MVTIKHMPLPRPLSWAYALQRRNDQTPSCCHQPTPALHCVLSGAVTLRKRSCSSGSGLETAVLCHKHGCPLLKCLLWISSVVEERHHAAPRRSNTTFAEGRKCVPTGSLWLPSSCSALVCLKPGSSTTFKGHNHKKFDIRTFIELRHQTAEWQIGSDDEAAWLLLLLLKWRDSSPVKL